MNIQGVTIIKSENHSIMTLMRLNTRWAQAKTRVSRDVLLLQEEGPLVQSFRRLNEYLEGIFDLREVDCVTYLAPFHQVIVSDQASGPLTSAALSSLSKFVLYGFLCPDYPRAREGMHLIAECISHCIFEESDWESDEVIFMKLLELSALTFRCNSSPLLTVEAAWDIYSTCINIHGQFRASKILRSEAETALRHLTLAAFSRAHVAAATPTNLMTATDEVTLSNGLDEGRLTGPGVTQCLVRLMTALAGLMDVQSQSADGVKFALSLVNVALEAGGPALGAMAPLVEILRGDICRHLLRASQSDDLGMFSLSLRVVFNLFMSIKDHMKVQLEVFLTSVHLRLLQQSAATGSNSTTISNNAASALARDELALESLLEFCREPSLMYDLYTNYDCDVQCTNLFDSIIMSLCARAVPSSRSPLHSTEMTTHNSSGSQSVRVSILNRLALDGVFAVLHAVASRCSLTSDLGGDDLDADREREKDRRERLRSSSTQSVASEGAFDIDGSGASLPRPPSTPTAELELQVDSWCCTDAGAGEPSSPGETPRATSEDERSTTHISLMPLNTSTPVKFDGPELRAPPSPSSSSDALDHGYGEVPPVGGDDEIDFLLQTRARTADVLRQRKLKKQRLKQAAEQFNAAPLKPAWLVFSLDLSLLSHASPNIIAEAVAPSLDFAPTVVATTVTAAATTTTTTAAAVKVVAPLDSALSVADARSVAKFLKNTPGLGKTQVGEFLSRGPADRYPFHAAVLKAYVDTFDFSGSNSSFVKALRTFLGHFRLPGEAQCIDRLMEAFSRRLFEHLGVGRPFASSDAAFILAFSTIMLNTDLHNPNLPPNKRMTREQFIRNNRGINDGADLPQDYLECLYDEIRTRQIQVDREVGDYSDGSAATASLTDASAWHRLLRKSAADQAPAIFTPTVAARSTKRGSGGGYYPPSVHERDMFLVMARPVLETIDCVLGTACGDDDLLTGRVVQALLDYACVCVSLGLGQTLSLLVEVLSARCRDILSVGSSEDEDEYGFEEENGKVEAEPDLEYLLGSGFESMLRGDRTWGLSSLTGVVNQGSPVGTGGSGVSSPSPATPSPARPAVHWAGAKAVRGQILVRALFLVAARYSRNLEVGGWAALLSLLLHVRTMGALPPLLAAIRDEFSLEETAGGLPSAKKQPATVFAERCHSAARGGDAVVKKRSSGILSSLAGLIWGGGAAEERRNRREEVVLDGNSCPPLSTSAKGGKPSAMSQSRQGALLKLSLLQAKADVIFLQPPSLSSASGVHSPIRGILLDAVLSALREDADKLLESTHAPSIDEAHMQSEALLPVDGNRELQAVLLLEWASAIVFGDREATSPAHTSSSTSSSPLEHSVLWARLAEFLFFVLEQAPDEAAVRCPYLLERIILVTLRAAGVILPACASLHTSGTSSKVFGNASGTYIHGHGHSGDAEEAAWQCLRLLGAVPREVLHRLSGRLGNGVAAVIFTHLRSVQGKEGSGRLASAPLARTTEQWHTLLALLATGTAAPAGRPPAWRALCALLDSRQLSALSISPCRLLLLRFLHGAYPEDDDEGGGAGTDAHVRKQSAPTNPHVEPAMRRVVTLTAAILAGYMQPATRSGLSHANQLQSQQEEPVPVVFSLAQRQSVGPSSKIDLPDASSAGAQSGQSHGQSVTVFPVRLPRPEAEGLWLDAVRRLADLAALIGAVLDVRRAALQNLQAVLSCGRHAGLPSVLWNKALADLLMRLPLSLAPQQGTAAQMQPSAEMVVRSCTVVFELLVSHIKAVREAPEFPQLWGRLCTILAGNAHVGLRMRNQSATLHNEMLEMIMALLRLLRPPTTASVSTSAVSAGGPVSASATSPTPGLGGGILRLMSPLLGGAEDGPAVSSPLPPGFTNAALLATQEADVDLLVESYKGMCQLCPSLPAALRERNGLLALDLQRLVEAADRPRPPAPVAPASTSAPAPTVVNTPISISAAAPAVSANTVSSATAAPTPTPTPVLAPVPVPVHVADDVHSPAIAAIRVSAETTPAAPLRQHPPSSITFVHTPVAAKVAAAAAEPAAVEADVVDAVVAAASVPTQSVDAEAEFAKAKACMPAPLTTVPAPVPHPPAPTLLPEPALLPPPLLVVSAPAPAPTPAVPTPVPPLSKTLHPNPKANIFVV